ncbi:MAG: thiamine phosphate synthase, partial [Selenomonadaceae bacterium]|nr:thiamine phosphate synthase [Selenomonadaceae bacterium]
MSIRERLDISAYLVIGQENTTRPVEKVIAAAVSEGFTCVQIRSKVATAREMIDTLGKTAAAIRELGKSDSVALLVDDRLDVVLAARDAGIKV